MGRGFYTISVDVGNATLSVDCFGMTQLFSNDREITYDVSTDSFYDESNEIITSIDLFDDPIGLQPSPPVDFICTNGNNNGSNPHFEWYYPYEPNRSNIDPNWPWDIKYKIYRSENFGPFYCVVSNLTFTKPPLEWTDYGVSINSNGIRYVYYATAYTDRSPESDKSDWTRVYGYSYKPFPEPTNNETDSSDIEHVPSCTSLSAYPNPFNPSTTIQYALPTASHVTLKVFNLRGELVKTLVDGFRTANRYRVVWNGENEAGAKVASGIYLYQLQTDNYSQIKRMIFIK